MKFIIDNYSDSYSTQPMQFHRQFVEKGIESNILDMSKISVYDTMDVLNPDILITTGTRITNAIIQYLKENKDKKLILNIDNLQQDQVKQIADLLKLEDISTMFFISSNYSLPKQIDKINVVKLLPSVDTYMVQKLDFEYNIELGLIVDSLIDGIAYPNTFHVISPNPSLNNKTDISLNCLGLRSIYDKYDTIVMKNLKNINQILLDALNFGNKVYYDNEEETGIETILKSVFKIDIKLDYNREDRTQDFSEIKKIILEKHTDSKRTKKLLSQIKG
tara:strand:+ start:150 stop:977 length:828 start_codon:yes stop_codon:yes gene_type:complete